METKKHVCKFVMGKSRKISTCACGRFRHEGNFTPIVEIPQHAKILHGLCKVCGHYGDDCLGTKPQHTPTPIDIVKRCSASGAFNEGSLLRYLDSDHVDTEAKLELAAFIVRAVNSHEDLLELLKKAMPCLASSPAFTCMSPLIQKMRKAIAKAEEK